MGAAGKNIDELLAADIPDNVSFIIQTGGAEKWRSHDIPADSLNRYSVKNGELTLLESLPQGNMGEQQTFSDFLSYGVQNYPAEKMCVIIWDHGGGSLDGVANDENYGFDALSLSEIDGALKAASESMTDRFELFGFDACLMANYETASVLSPYAHFLLASEEIEPSGGWDYSSMIKAVADDKKISGGDLGKAVCDGYFAKCQASGKDSSATLSVTDLTKFNDVQKTFDTVAQNMNQNASEAKGIQAIAQSAKNSRKYGGTTADEGFSNLIDLHNFAENAVDVNGTEDLMKAVENAVVYKVGGSEKSKSGGLSFYYPMVPDKEKLTSYFTSICPSEPYKTYLKTVYENIPENPITFTDSGSKAEDGSFQIKLDEASRNYILSVDFQLIRCHTGENAENIFSEFGQDNDMFTDEEALSYHSNFRGIWLVLNDCWLYVTPVEDTEEYIIFTAPIILNGQRTNLRFAFIWDDAYAGGGYYKIIGAWNGIDPVTGMSDKEITLLQPNDDVRVISHHKTNSLDSEMQESATRVVSGDYTVFEKALGDTEYLYQFVVTDIFGGKHYSNVCRLIMDKNAAELEEHPLDDGEYAAHIDSILDYSGKSMTN